MGDLFQARHTLKSILDNYEPAGEDDQVLQTAREKYETLMEKEEEQIKSDTTKDQIEIRMEESTRDTTKKKPMEEEPPADESASKS